jgi:hypothetical protein
MRLELDKNELMYVSGLLRVMAERLKANKESYAVFASLAHRFSPNRTFVPLRNKEAQLILTIVEKTVADLTSVKGKVQNEEQKLRAIVLDGIFASVKQKLTDKLAISQGDEDVGTTEESANRSENHDAGQGQSSAGHSEAVFHGGGSPEANLGSPASAGGLGEGHQASDPHGQEGKQPDGSLV